MSGFRLFCHDAYASGSGRLHGLLLQRGPSPKRGQNVPRPGKRPAPQLEAHAGGIPRPGLDIVVTPCAVPWPNPSRPEAPRLWTITPARFELEMAFVTRQQIARRAHHDGRSREPHLRWFFNDWSARDIQKEYVFGPFLGKNFGPPFPWIVTLEALDHLRVAGQSKTPRCWVGQNTRGQSLRCAARGGDHSEGASGQVVCDPTSVTCTGTRSNWPTTQSMDAIWGRRHDGQRYRKGPEKGPLLHARNLRGTERFHARRLERKFIQDGDTGLMRAP